MPPRPSSLPFRVGTDIVRINRIKGILNGGKTNQPGDPKKLASFLIRIMTPWERHVFYKRFADQDRALVAGIFGTCQYLAGRFAAKEAVIKAFPTRNLYFKDVEIRTSKRVGERFGEPYAIVFDQPYFSILPGKAKKAAEANEAVEPSAEAAEAKETAEPSTDVPEAENIESAEPEAQPETQKKDYDGQIVPISISHDGEYATAVCIAPVEPVPGDVGGEAEARGL